MEAPNRITFQSQMQGVAPVSSANPATFQALFESAKVASNDQYPGPSTPKSGVTWLEVSPRTPYRDAQQQLNGLTQPTVLKFTGLSASFDGATPILNSAKNNPHIRHFIVRYSSLSDHHAQLINQVLKTNDGIAWLVLDHNKMDNQRLKKIMDDLPNPRGIQHLVLSHNELTDDSVDDLIEGFKKMPKLKTVWLADNKFTADGVHRLKTYLSNKSGLKTLDV